MRQNKALLGKYFPSFFSIELSDTKDIYSTTIIDNCTLFHEYIHFLQDITTTSGFVKLYNVKENINLIRTQTIGTQEISVPYQFDEKNQINEAVFEVIDSYDVNHFFNYQIKKIEKNDLNRAVRLTISDGKRDTVCFFGSYQIEEIMAECCESQHSHHQDTNEYPYDLWLRFNEYFKYDLRKEDYALISYVSLFSCFPGYEFIFILDSIRRGTALETALKNSFSNHKKDWILFKQHAIDSMKYFFSENFPAICQWYEKCVDQNNLLEDFDHIKVFLRDMLHEQSLFSQFVQNQGIPIVSDCYDERNNDCHYGFGVNKDYDSKDFYALIALRDIYNLLLYGRKPCTMVTMCYESGHGGVSLDCGISPWCSNHGDRKCYYEVMWNALFLPKQVNIL